MERRNFIKSCCVTAAGIPIAASVLQSCGAIYYATSTTAPGKLTVALSEFVKVKKNKEVERAFVLVKSTLTSFPICVYEVQEDKYIASLMKCTHNACELNVGGGIYTCPCHGSEFSNSGKVLEGPADKDLKTYRTDTDDENLYIYVS